VTFEELRSQFRVGDTYIYKFSLTLIGVLKVKNINPLKLVFPDSYEENIKAAPTILESSGYVWRPGLRSSLRDLLKHPYQQPYKVYYRKEVKEWNLRKEIQL